MQLLHRFAPHQHSMPKNNNGGGARIFYSDVGTLRLLHGSNVSGLDVVLELLDLLLKVGDGDLLILNNEVDLELLDTETNGDELGSTPSQTVLLNRTDGSLESSHVSLVIWRLLNVKSDDGLGDGLGLVLLLLAVLSKALLADASGLSILLLIVATEQVDIVVLLSGGLLSLLRGLGGVEGHLSGAGTVGAVGSRSITGKGGELALVAGDVLVPSSGVGVALAGGGAGESLEGSNISLRGRLADTC
ncbi:hypothetical protein HG531_001666 [Fusarium graminearum]|nr:hypothetical protein HG531_001666 [Fusarium graminearum]